MLRIRFEMSTNFEWGVYYVHAECNSRVRDKGIHALVQLRQTMPNDSKSQSSATLYTLRLQNVNDLPLVRSLLKAFVRETSLFHHAKSLSFLRFLRESQNQFCGWNESLLRRCKVVCPFRKCSTMTRRTQRGNYYSQSDEWSEQLESFSSNGLIALRQTTSPSSNLPDTFSSNEKERDSSTNLSHQVDADRVERNGGGRYLLISFANKLSFKRSIPCHPILLYKQSFRFRRFWISSNFDSTASTLQRDRGISFNNVLYVNVWRVFAG